MKKFSVLIALALLAVAGTGYAITCAYDNVPAATLLVPYFRVSRNGSTGADIPGGGVDTLVAVTNVSTPGVIAHITVWNKYSKAVLDFNLPLTGKDTASFSMRAILNGQLNFNATQKLPDPCGLNLTNNTYAPKVGYGQTNYIRFSHPQAIANPPTGDPAVSISVYATPAFSGAFRQKVWDSLDESGDVISFQSPGAGNVLDTSNPGCNSGTFTGYSGDFSGYLTIDVVNYCTNFFPDQGEFYNLDAIATSGWTSTATPNCLMGDVFYIDPAASAGNISGDPAVALEFDTRLVWSSDSPSVGGGPKTFYGRNVQTQAIPNCALEDTTAGCQNVTNYPAAYHFGGDGREPLGDRYGFRYLSDTDNQLQTWILVWRGDLTRDVNSDGTLGTVATQQNLCHWLRYGAGEAGAGFFEDDHQIITFTYDNDENVNVPGSGGPSGGGGGAPGQNYIFLEASRIKLLGNTEINPNYNQATRSFVGGWIDMQLRGPNPGNISAGVSDIFYNQAWVGVQHAGPGVALSVGHSATLLYPQFLCNPAIQFGAGNTP
jgi:hypothetical protein